MIVGIGLDLVEMARIEKAYKRFGLNFALRILTPSEMASGNLTGEAVPGEVRFLASRFAAKEAASKALGTGFAHGVTLHGIEVVRHEGRRPEIIFMDSALGWAKKLNVTHGHLSISHEKSMVAATVVLENRLS